MPKLRPHRTKHKLAFQYADNDLKILELDTDNKVWIALKLIRDSVADLGKLGSLEAWVAYPKKGANRVEKVWPNSTTEKLLSLMS